MANKKNEVPEEEIIPEPEPEETEAVETEQPPAPPPQTNEKPVKPAAKAGGFCVYLGPSISGVIVSGTVYKTDKAATLLELAPVIEKYPLIASLLVTGDELPGSRIKVKTPGTLLYANYSKFTGQLKN